MNQTSNYKLPQWVEEDRIMMEDFNDAMAKIDAGIAGAQESADSKATAEAVAALQTAIGSGGSTARIAWGNYTGTGTYGEGNPTVLTFDFKPMAILIAQADTSNSTEIGIITMIRGMPMSFYNANFYSTPTWLDNGVSMFSWSSAANQMNAQKTYYYVAIGQALTA